MAEHRFNLKQISESIALIQDQEACIVAIINQCWLLLYVIDRIYIRSNDELSLVLHEDENLREWKSFRFQSTKSNIFASLGSIITIGKSILEGRFEDSDYPKLALKFITGLLMHLGYVADAFLSDNGEMSLEQEKNQLLYNFQALATIIPFSQRRLIKVCLSVDENNHIGACVATSRSGRHPIEINLGVDENAQIKVRLITHQIENIYSARLGWIEECKEEHRDPELSIIPGPYDEIIVEE